MSFQVTSRHFELPEVFAQYITYKLTKFEHLFRRVINVSVTVSKIKEGLFESKITLQLPKKEVITSSNEDHSLVKAFDESFDHAYRRLKEYKSRLGDIKQTVRLTRRMKRNLTF